MNKSTERMLSRLGLQSEWLGTLDDLSFMAQYKFDHYEMFLPGMRFMDQLTLWLEQFDLTHRPTALRLVRDKLIYISQREMQELAHFLYYDEIIPRIMNAAMSRERLPKYSHREIFDQHLDRYLRASLFMGLSDGARIDFFRRHHIQLSQDQVIPYYRAHHTDYLNALRAETGDQAAEFRLVFLVDDFTASGYTLIHRDESGAYHGSLIRLYEQHRAVIDRADRVCIAYYIATQQAMDHVLECLSYVPGYRHKTEFITALPLGPECRISSPSPDPLDALVLDLCDTYYSPAFENVNTRKGGSIKLGFGGSALSLVTYSNCPNNSVFPIWLDREPSVSNPGFVPLFRRIDRHRQA